MNKMLSIIIPHFQQPKKLAKLLSTIPSNMQTIVVDDNSNCSSELEALAAEHLNVELHYLTGEPKGAGYARNVGLNYATGEFILFADSDDVFTNDAFTIVSEYLASDFDIVYFSPISCHENKDQQSKRHLWYSRLVENYLADGNEDIRYKFHVPWSKLVSKQLIDDFNIKFDEVMASNDVMFSLKCGFFAKLIHVDINSIYCVLEHSKSLTQKKSEKIIDTRFEVMCRYNDFLNENGMPEKKGAMSGHLNNALKFGMKKLIVRLVFCYRKGYPIFYSVKHLFNTLRYFVKK